VSVSIVSAPRSPGLSPETRPPRRGVLRLAGVLSQLICAAALLVGTVALVIVKQNAHGAGIEFVIGWLAVAMLGLVSGGLVYRGSLSSLVLCAAADAAMGAVLLLIDSALGVLARILSTADVDTLGTLLRGLAIGMISVGGLCVLAIPQALRYASWLTEANEPDPSKTTIGFPPPPVQSWRRSMQTSIVEASSRRRFWFVIGGIVVGAGIGLAIIVTDGTQPTGKRRREPSVASPPPARDAGVAVVADAATHTALLATTPVDAGTAPVDARPTSDAGTAAQAQAQAQATDSLDAMLDGEHVDLAKGDIHALAQRASSTILGFGVDADELIDGRASFEATLNKDLGVPPPGGFDIDLKYLQIGQEHDVAWTAEELAITAHGKTRVFAITQLVGKVDNKWSILAWHWAFGVSDAVASRMVAAGTMQPPKAIADSKAGAEPIDATFREAFASPQGYAEAISSRQDAFNFGSSSEHVVGGQAIRQVFAHLPAKLGIHDGVKAIAIGKDLGVAAANIDFTATRTKQTFRVLTVLLRERTTWHVVQTQWSNGGPLR